MYVLLMQNFYKVQTYFSFLLMLMEDKKLAVHQSEFDYSKFGLEGHSQVRRGPSSLDREFGTVRLHQIHSKGGNIKFEVAELIHSWAGWAIPQYSLTGLQDLLRCSLFFLRCLLCPSSVLHLPSMVDPQATMELITTRLQ